MQEQAATNRRGEFYNSVSWVDYDLDGFLDLFVTMGASDGTTPIKNLLFHNNGNTNSSLAVKCIGTVSNRSAIGAKVRVRATIGGKTFWQMREINHGGGWNSQPLVVHFGLGDAKSVDVIRIEWPSGAIQEFQNLALTKHSNYSRVYEPFGLIAEVTNGIPTLTLKAWNGFTAYIETSGDLKNWNPLELDFGIGLPGLITTTKADGAVTIRDTSATNSSIRFYRARRFHL